MPPIRLLLVEDDALTAGFLRQDVERLGYQVVGLTTVGAEAVTLATTLQPDLVLMDIHLADDADGIDVAVQIQAAHDVPIVYLTTDDDDATLERAVANSPFGYLVKPINRSDLRRTLALALRLHAQDQALKDSAARYRLLTELMTDVVWNLDPETMRFVYVSPSVELLRGYTPEEVMAQSVDEALTPASQAYLAQIMPQRIADFQAAPTQERFYTDEVEQPCRPSGTVWTEAVTR